VGSRRASRRRGARRRQDRMRHRAGRGGLMGELVCVECGEPLHCPRCTPTLTPMTPRIDGSDGVGDGKGCGYCGASLVGLRSDARFCSASCRQRAYVVRRGGS
jgi:hypothetical protein